MAFHQDQVMKLPFGARRLAGNAFCPTPLTPSAGKSSAFRDIRSFSLNLPDALLQKRGADMPLATTTAAHNSLKKPINRTTCRQVGWRHSFIRRHKIDKIQFFCDNHIVTKAQILDIQSGGDTRALTVDRVGICGIRLPMNFDEGGRSHPSVGEWKCYTDLSAQSRGTHMSRLVRALHDACEGFSYDTFRALPEKVIQRLSDASRCELSVNFDCFIEKRAPVSEEVGYIDCQTAFYARQSRTEKRFLIRVTTPVTSLCPCSKAISKHGAHNQRSHLSLTVEPDSGARVRDIVALIESCASCDFIFHAKTRR